MKRFLLMFLILGLAVGSVAAAEAKKANRKRVERTVRASYEGHFAPFVIECESTYGCVRVETFGPKERLFTAEVKDAHGQPVFVWVESDDERVGTFCGKTAKPISVDPGADLEFWIGAYWSAPPECPGGRISTTGTIRVTLSSRP